MAKQTANKHHHEEHLQKVISHNVFASGQKIFENFANCATPMCPSSHISALNAKLKSGTADQHKVVLAAPWPDLLSWAEAADQACSALRSRSSGQVQSAAGSAEALPAESGTDKNNKMAVVVPSFIVALRYVKDIDDNKGQIKDQFSSENDEDNSLEKKSKRCWAFWEKAIEGSVQYGQNLRDTITQCCAFDEQTRCELEVRCGILTGEASLKGLFNGMSVATTKAHLEGVGAELKKSLRTLGAKKALEALEAASVDKEPPLDGMNAIRAKPGAREVVNRIACFRDVQKLF